MENPNLCIGGCRITQLTEILNKILDPNTVVIFTTAPAPRSAVGQYFGLENFNAQTKIVGFFKMLGADYVFDTAFGADLTTISEAYEFVDRLKAKNNLPMLNSCCPAFVKYIENFRKDLLPNLSTAKTPIAEIATFARTVFAQNNNIDPKNIFIVALTPCLAKKIEIKSDYIDIDTLEKFNTQNSKTYKKRKKKSHSKITRSLLKKLQKHEIECTKSCQKPICNKTLEKPLGKIQLTDAVITTTELIHMMNLCGITLDDIEDCECDSLFGESVKFGKSGGVLECVVENAYYILNNKKPPFSTIKYTNLGNDIYQANVELSENQNIKIAKIMGLRHLEEFFKSPSFKDYAFIEVMTCNCGCIGGTGQPTNDKKILNERKKILLKNAKKRYAFNNTIAMDAFEKYKNIFYDD